MSHQSKLDFFSFKSLISLDVEEKNRDIELDYYRGLGMLIVMLQHVGSSFGYSRYLLAFHMPMFFLLSGYSQRRLGKNRNVSLRQFACSRFYRLIIPYFAFEFICLIISYIVAPAFGNHIVFFKAIESIFLCLNNDDYMGVMLRLWFLPCMFWADLILYAYKNCKSVFVKRLILLCTFAFSFVICTYLKVRLPFTIDIAMLASGFLLVGYECGAGISRMIALSIGKKVFTFLLSTGGFIVSVLYNTQPVYMYNNEYGIWSLGIFGAFCGSISFILLASILIKTLMSANLLHKLIMWVSQNSLIVFPVHGVIVYFTIRILNKFFGINHWSVRFIIVLALTIPVVNFIEKYFPVLGGKKRSK